MIIEDNGLGFNINEIGSNQYGLSMLKERSEKLNCILEIDTKVNRGTKIILRGNKEDDKSI
jgi:nitrate/nitrite-specific signal transduction histidine kinase